MEKRKGRLQPGYNADLVICDNLSNIQMTISKGRILWSAGQVL
jgi:N-acetylglucosamine-6-phosphate deacetylase